MVPAMYARVSRFAVQVDLVALVAEVTPRRWRPVAQYDGKSGPSEPPARCRGGHPLIFGVVVAVHAPARGGRLIPLQVGGEHMNICGEYDGRRQRAFVWGLHGWRVDRAVGGWLCGRSGDSDGRPLGSGWTALAGDAGGLGLARFVMVSLVCAGGRLVRCSASVVGSCRRCGVDGGVGVVVVVAEC